MERRIDSSGGCRRRRVVLFPLPFQGHINPMLQLANILYSKGFSITILHITLFNSPYTSNYPHFTFQSVDIGSKDDKLAKLSFKGVGDLIWAVLILNQHGSDCFREELNQMLIASKDEDEPIACLITDALWYFTQSVADSLNLPRIVLRTSSLFCLLVYASIPHLDDLGYFNHANSVFDEERTYLDVKMSKDHVTSSSLEERVHEFPILKVKDILKMRIKVKSDPSSDLLANMVKQTKASSGIIWNACKELEEPELQNILQEFHVPNFLIGPFYKYFPASSSSLLEQDRSFLQWLNAKTPNSVLYVSFGSVAQLNEKDFLEIAYGLAMSKQSFLWVVRPGSVVGSEWLEPLPDGFVESVGERGRIVKWAPQQEVLAHEAIGAFWTHSGWNSTLESVCEGVPMICSPFWGDQPLDARYASDVWRVSVYLENDWEREEIASVIKRVMVDEDMRERARCLKEKVNISLVKGGSSYESLEALINYLMK